MNCETDHRGPYGAGNSNVDHPFWPFNGSPFRLLTNFPSLVRRKSKGIGEVYIRAVDGNCMENRDRESTRW